MAFTYNAEFTVHSVIDNLNDSGLPDGDPEINIFTTIGTVRFDDDRIGLKYDEISDDYTTHCDLTAVGERVLLSRKGAVDCDIVFEEGQTHSCIYRVPPYAFDMSISTAKIRNSITEEGGELQLIYSMNIGGQDKKVRMKIKTVIKN